MSKRDLVDMFEDDLFVLRKRTKARQEYYDVDKELDRIDIPLSQMEEIPLPCTCPISDVMTQGCKCDAAFQMEDSDR